MPLLYGGIEAGGNSFVCAVGTGPNDLERMVSIPTTTPEETISRVIDYFRGGGGNALLRGIGVGAFGPLDLDSRSATFGYITSTPKPDWADTDLRGKIERALGLPVAIDTDVNASALGEHRWGAAGGLDSFIYLTVGTGTGGGAMVDGGLLHGMIHPEMGHMRLPHDWDVDPFEGICPYHGDCFEGLASGPAIKGRWGTEPERLPVDHLAWELETTYIALGVANMVCALSPSRVIIGGGVMKQLHLFPLIRRKVEDALGGYVRSPEILDGIDLYIVPPGLGERSGVLGAIALAQDGAQQPPQADG